MGTGQKPPGHNPPNKSSSDKSPPRKKNTYDKNKTLTYTFHYWGRRGLFVGGLLS